MKQRYISQLRLERERRGWSRNYIAEQIEVDMVSVGRWERGEHQPHPVYRQKLCALFEMNAQDLGLFAEPSQEPEEEIATAEVPVETLDRGYDATAEHALEPHILDATALVASPSKQIVEKKNKPIATSLRTRRALLIGLGSSGILALTGTGLLITSRPSQVVEPKPVHITTDIPLQRFFDPGSINWINRLSWSPDERYIASATGTNLVTIWNRENGEIVRSYQTPNLWVNDVSWSKTNWIAMASADYHTGSLETWDSLANKPVVKLQRPYSLRSVSWSPDGKLLAFAGRSPIVEVWDPFSQQLINKYTYPALGTQEGISRVRWSSKGDLLACAADDGTVHVWEALTGRVKTIYRKHQIRVIDIAWSPDGQYIASASADKTARVWEVASGRTACVYQGHTNQVEGIDWSLQGKYIATGGKDQTAQVWEALTGQLIISYEKLNSIVETTLWSKDGKTVALGTNSEGIEIWKVL